MFEYYLYYKVIGYVEIFVFYDEVGIVKCVNYNVFFL